MASENPHTGQKQQTKPPSQAYKDNWEKIFGKNPAPATKTNNAPLAQ